MTAAPAADMTRFNTLWGGQTISNFGDRITELALPVIAVVTLGATPAEVGLLTAAVWTPNLLSLLVGSWVDRRAHRRRLLVAADVLRALVLLSLPIAHWLGVVTLAQLFAVALLAGVGQVLFNAAYPSFFVALVDRNRYVDANSKLSISRSASFVAGPALGGFLIQRLTAPIALLVDAASFLASAVLISRIDVAPAAPEPSRSLMSDARAGLRYVLGHRYLRAGLGCVTTINFFGFVAQALVVLFATRTLGLPVSLLGLALGVGAFGGLAGAALAPRLSRRFGIGRVMLLGAFLFPAPTAAIALAGGPHWASAAVLSAAEAVSGFGVMLMDINLNSVQAAVMADDMRSRVAGVFGTINYGARPLGAALGGVLGGVIGVRPTLLIAAVGGVLGCLWLLTSPLPAIRTLDGGPP
ncbi:MFS transporter [Winogradskya consettensis]|uniref:MFS transporter n=1 Tax=Winogradskya consettensis TaxID=113560 RepID=A0A919VQH5_9ACTN|nr:MFS transporter [Actinoplanes consettensis]GIM72566.1 MFS transporter [Actinoplanes consettensis]